MSTVKEILDQKGRELWSIGSGKTVYQAIELMAEKHIGALTVVDDTGRLEGILSERDYARKVILKNRSSKDTLVREIMTSEVISVKENEDLQKCMSIMSQNKIRHLPIVTDQNLNGMITVGDLMNYIIDDQSKKIEGLRSIIMDETGGQG